MASGRVIALLAAGSASAADLPKESDYYPIQPVPNPDNFVLEVTKHGMSKRDIVPNINFFMNVPVEADGALGIVDGISAPGLVPLKRLVIAECLAVARADGVEFRATLRLDTPREREYVRHGGILPYVLRRLLAT